MKQPDKADKMHSSQRAVWRNGGGTCRFERQCRNAAAAPSRRPVGCNARRRCRRVEYRTKKKVQLESVVETTTDLKRKYSSTIK